MECVSCRLRSRNVAVSSYTHSRTETKLSTHFSWVLASSLPCMGRRRPLTEPYGKNSRHPCFCVIKVFPWSSGCLACPSRYAESYCTTVGVWLSHVWEDQPRFIAIQGRKVRCSFPKSLQHTQCQTLAFKGGFYIWGSFGSALCFRRVTSVLSAGLLHFLLLCSCGCKGIN